MSYSYSSPQDSFLNHPSTLCNNPYISQVSYASLGSKNSESLGHGRNIDQCPLHPESCTLSFDFTTIPWVLGLCPKTWNLGNSETWKLRIWSLGLLPKNSETWTLALQHRDLGISLSSASGMVCHHLQSELLKSRSITWPHNYSTSPNSNPLLRLRSCLVDQGFILGFA